jgi:hypothetical protein
MKLLRKACHVGESCPAVYDPEDGSGDVILVATWVGDSERRQLEQRERSEFHRDHVGESETVVRISRSLIVDALKQSV